ncbi:hypothetical protein BDA99DRAFT_230925 [Phascolomyces articulosus]|uniref:RanBP-type and C3HC4-type zinc finger-containing protein 1 n=1 Tax=Phascolomyces articulosus TaxID=60185 RepID=A0AAD5P8R9_9FUNG|nr:hypothetical protein BDA99DRAFT_230925 [Phascolomyces articulosus]
MTLISSILNLQSQLQCDLCDNLLNETRIVKTCEHRFCRWCAHDKVGVTSQCPKCQAPAFIKDLRPDPMHDTLVACVRKLSTLVAGGTPSMDSKLFGSVSSTGSGQQKQQQHDTSLTRRLSTSMTGGGSLGSHKTHSVPLSFTPSSSLLCQMAGIVNEDQEQQPLEKEPSGTKNGKLTRSMSTMTATRQPMTEKDTNVLGGTDISLLQNKMKRAMSDITTLESRRMEQQQQQLSVEDGSVGMQLTQEDIEQPLSRTISNEEHYTPSWLNDMLNRSQQPSSFSLNNLPATTSSLSGDITHLERTPELLRDWLGNPYEIEQSHNTKRAKEHFFADLQRNASSLTTTDENDILNPHPTESSSFLPQKNKDKNKENNEQPVHHLHNNKKETSFHHHHHHHTNHSIQQHEYAHSSSSLVQRLDIKMAKPSQQQQQRRRPWSTSKENSTDLLLAELQTSEPPDDEVPFSNKRRKTTTPPPSTNEKKETAPSDEDLFKLWNEQKGDDLPDDELPPFHRKKQQQEQQSITTTTTTTDHEVLDDNMLFTMMNTTSEIPDDEKILMKKTKKTKNPKEQLQQKGKDKRSDTTSTMIVDKQRDPMKFSSNDNNKNNDIHSGGDNEEDEDMRLTLSHDSVNHHDGDDDEDMIETLPLETNYHHYCENQDGNEDDDEDIIETLPLETNYHGYCDNQDGNEDDDEDMIFTLPLEVNANRSNSANNDDNDGTDMQLTMDDPIKPSDPPVITTTTTTAESDIFSISTPFPHSSKRNQQQSNDNSLDNKQSHPDTTTKDNLPATTESLTKDDQQQEQESTTWLCAHCHFENKKDLESCLVCRNDHGTKPDKIFPQSVTPESWSMSLVSSSASLIFPTSQSEQDQLADGLSYSMTYSPPSEQQPSKEPLLKPVIMFTGIPPGTKTPS